MGIPVQKLPVEDLASQTESVVSHCKISGFLSMISVNLLVGISQLKGQGQGQPIQD